MPAPIEYDNGYKVNFRFKGERYQKRFPFELHEDAKAAALQYMQDIKAGVNIEKTVKHTLPTELKKYILFCQRNKSPKTVRSDIQRLSIFERFANEIKLKRSKDINKDVIRQFEDYFFENYPFTDRPVHRRGAEPNPKSTWEKYRQIVAAYCNWCIEHKYLKVNPLSKAKEFKKKYQKTVQKTFTADELKILFKHFDTMNSIYLSAFYRILAYTGMRCSEVTDMKWDWITIDGDDSYIEVKETKNYTPRIIPISKKILPYFKKLPKDKPLVFSNKSGHQLFTASWYIRLLYEALEVHTLQPDRNLHSFRHTFCTQLLENGESLKTVMELAGHKNITTTLGYLHLTKANKRNAIKGLKF